jgi:hypothetical protein
LTTSRICMSRSISGLSRCDRSATPVSVGVNTSWLFAASDRATPAPRPVPCAVNENKDAHVFLQENRRQCMYALRSSSRTWFAAEKSTTEFDRTAPSADRFSKFFFAMEAAKLFTSRRVAMLQFSRCSVPLGHLSGSKFFYRMVQ